MVIIFISYQVLAVDDDQQVIEGDFTFAKTDLVKLLLEAVTGCLSEKRYLKAIKNNLKLNQIP